MDRNDANNKNVEDKIKLKKKKFKRKKTLYYITQVRS